MQKGDSVVLGGLLGLTILGGGILMTANTVADDDTSVSTATITVAESCSMVATTDTAHTATIPNGIYSGSSDYYPNGIGQTTLKVYCNDTNGFSIYAIGYTGEQYSGEDHTKLIGTDDTNKIVTGTANSGQTSNWAMKLATNAQATYPITLENGYGSFSAVPDTYTKVATRAGSTDVGDIAAGASLTTTYAAYISPTQLADTYTGKVKYTMVHPASAVRPVADNEIAVVFHGNGLTFPGGISENSVVYEDGCTDMYQGSPTISKTANIDNDAQMTGPLPEGTTVLDPITLSGADMLKVELAYNADSGVCMGVTNAYIDDWEYSFCHDGSNWDYYQYIFHEFGGIESKTFYVHGDTVTFDFASDWATYDANNTWGYYAKVYPIYKTAQAGAEVTSVCAINPTPASGAYTTTTTWNGRWYLPDFTTWFENEGQVLEYLEERKESFLGTMKLDLYSAFPYKIYYDGNNATAGTMNGFYSIIPTQVETSLLAVPNFYKTNYGFAGWSEDQNATVNSGARIFGPNEAVDNEDLNFNSSNHEATLYAVWAPSAGNLQGWSGCSNLSQGEVTALTDTRDNNTYAVAKLADDKCWMIENLRLDAANSGDSSKAQGFGGAFSGLANSESSNFSNSTASNSKYSTSNITGSNQAYRFPRYNNSNTSSYTTNMTTSDANIYGYGNYYTWAAAMANTTNLTTKTASEAANTSICPNGWKLPYGGNSGNGNTAGGFYYLNYKLNGDSNVSDRDAALNLRAYPNNFVHSGQISTSTYYYRGGTGLYWASAATSGSQATNLSLRLNTVNPGTISASKSYGYSIRCVAGS